MASHSGRWAGTDDVDDTMMSQRITVVLWTVKSQNRRKNCLCLFWFLACTANVNNCKPAWLLLGGHREVRTVEKIAHEHTTANFYIIAW